MFKNPRFFEIRNISYDLNLEEQLAKLPARPPHDQEMQTIGFTSPFGPKSELMTHVVAPYIRISLVIEKKVIPSAVVKIMLIRRIAKIEKEEDRILDKSEIKTLKEVIFNDLKKTAFTKHKFIDALLSIPNKLMVINAASDSDCESFLASFKKVVEIDLSALSFDRSPIEVMTTWLRESTLPDDLLLGKECLLKSVDEEPSTISCAKQEEIDDEMAIHLENGKFVASLSLVWRGSYGMTLNNNLTIKKFKCLEKSPDSEDDLDYQTILDNELAEYGPLYGQLSQSLSSWFQETVE